MKIELRNYVNGMGFANDFFEVREFFVKHGGVKLNENWHWGRWEWLIGHPYLKKEMLPIIGIWRSHDEVVAVATHDLTVGEAYLVCNPAHRSLLPQMVQYAQEHLSLAGVLRIVANDQDQAMIEILRRECFSRTESTEVVASLKYRNKIFEYSLPEGYSVTSFNEWPDEYALRKVIWKGFDHDGLPPKIEEEPMIFRPHFKPTLCVFILSPKGEYAAHCGMWYDTEIQQAYIEPVVTVPEHRRLGLGKAAVYECVNRCIQMGAREAQVISAQAFYKKIGFEERSVYHVWEKSV